MEDEVKEDPIEPEENSEQPKETPKVKSQWKSGWVKKASGRFLASYKDRYIEVEKTEIAVYENEDLKTCLGKVDLENYDKCHELKSAFSKKNRLVLIRALKSGNKVHDVKFQAPNPEEKEAWIKAFSDGINRAKNKIFDEVKIDETSNLEHVTRSRPKANRNRRPPTRVHMKEAAGASSEGILRLDLDTVDGSIPNGTNHMSTDGTETPKQVVKPPMPPTSKPSDAPEECPSTQSPDSGLPAEEKPAPQKVKPPMPPSKEAKAVAWMELPSDSESCPEKKVLKPPMPPSKETKPVVCAEDQTQVLHPPVPPSKEVKPSFPAGDQPTRDASRKDSPEECSDVGADSEPASTPADKPTGGSADNLVVDPESQPRPPALPSKDKKPSLTDIKEAAVETGVQMKKEEEDDETEGADEVCPKTTASDVQPSRKPVGAEGDVGSTTNPEVKVEPLAIDHPKVKVTATEENMPEKTVFGGEDITSNDEPPAMNASQTTVPESLPTQKMVKRIPCPPVKQKPVKPSLLATTSPAVENAQQNVPSVIESKCEFPVIVLSLSDPDPDSSCSSPLPFHLSPKKRRVRQEEKSVDSGQQSDGDDDDDEDDDGSENGDTLAASTSALRGSLVHLDTLMDDCEDEDTETPDSLEDASSTLPEDETFSLHSTYPKSSHYPPIPLKPSSKLRSTSLGDLLSDGEKGAGRKHTGPCHNVTDLTYEVALELEKTGELLESIAPRRCSEVGQSSALAGAEVLEEGSPEDLLARAMDKLRKADQFLREARNLKETRQNENMTKRTSW
ncbi:hypothetical protein DPEC_G00252860 [Dallia pectoralis]|uniref:Uncharacterized protein n=1 Tax=Dallia pectoralis TaxID=75939 RepID=A0ACC2FTI5_DALPE|nr:hypothetical protein DPEC_G00252860 [Dallia pectoralis]